MEGGDRFPADNIPHVWENVFNKLDPKDKLAFSGTSSVWHDWVEPQRAESLISEVAPYFIERCEPLYSGLGGQARELCQSLKEGIDEENQTHGSNTRLYFEIGADEGPHRLHDSRRPRLSVNVFNVTEDVQNFMQDMRTHAGNPFPGRSIRCHCNFVHDHEDLGDEWREYWSSIISLLDIFGTHVHFAKFYFDGYAELRLGNLEIQRTLRECLLRLPNLKRVDVYWEYENPLLEDEIQEFYRRNPLPQLEHLETVELSYTSLATVDAVLNSCCVPANVKRLSVHQRGKEHPKRVPLCEAVYGFHNLEVLQALILLGDLERLGSLERRPPLREVELSFDYAPYLEDVFTLLEPFAETLIQFRTSVRLPLRNRVVNGNPFSCNLPHLKKVFFVEYCGTPYFLFRFKSLTHVEICGIGDWDIYRRVPGFEERLHDSSIWRLMPCLQSISLGCPATVYERVVVEQPREVLEHQPQDWVDNHDTEGVRETTWSGECRSIVVDMIVSVLTDYFHGLLF